jgi:hypothetical protein
MPCYTACCVLLRRDKFLLVLVASCHLLSFSGPALCDGAPLGQGASEPDAVEQRGPARDEVALSARPGTGEQVAPAPRRHWPRRDREPQPTLGLPGAMLGAAAATARGEQVAQEVGSRAPQVAFGASRTSRGPPERPLVITNV